MIRARTEWSRNTLLSFGSLSFAASELFWQRFGVLWRQGITIPLALVLRFAARVSLSLWGRGLCGGFVGLESLRDLLQGLP